MKYVFSSVEFLPASRRLPAGKAGSTASNSARILPEKIYFPSAGLTTTTLSDPEAGPHPVLYLELLAGFSPPRDRKSCRTSFVPDCVGETNFLLRDIPLSNHREALAKGRIGFEVTRNLTRRHGKADGPASLLWRGTAEGSSHAVSSRFLVWNPTEARVRSLSVVVCGTSTGGEEDSV